MEPISLLVGAAAGVGASKLMGRKKKTTSGNRKKTTATKRKTTGARKTTKRKTTAKKRTCAPKKKATGAGINKTTGRLKKGYRYSPSGRVVKAKAKK